MNYSILYECYCRHDSANNDSGLNRAYPLKIVDTSDEDIKRFFHGSGFIEFKYIWDGSGYRIKEKNHCKYCMS
jgi:hypothetical protein